MTASDSALTIVGARESAIAPFTSLVAAGIPQNVRLVNAPSSGTGENDLFAATTGADGSTWAVGWFIDPASGNHQTLIEQGVNGGWSLVASPDPGTGDNGFAGIAAIPGGGVWALAITANNGNYSTLVAHHC